MACKMELNRFLIVPVKALILSLNVPFYQDDLSVKIRLN